MFKLRAKMISVGLLGAAAIVPFDFAKADQHGQASWYSLPGNKTANGERMNPSDLTAAHRSLPFGTRVVVENLSNGRSVVVRINDRGPFIGGRIIDLSKAAAASIGMIAAGTAKVRVTTTGGGALAALGAGSTRTKNENGDSKMAQVSSEASPPGELRTVSAKMTGAADQAAKQKLKAKPKPSSMTQVAAKTAKIKSLAVKSPGTTKKRPGAQTVKVAAKAPTATKKRVRSEVVRVAATKRVRPSASGSARVQVAAATAGIRAAGREASKLSTQRVVVAANGLRAAGREASKLASRRTTLASNHPYAVLGTTPAFMKPGRTSERRAQG
jgi:rare lipoprotein A